MNTDPADTHLDLAELIAEVTGQTPNDQAREHLARCEHCRAELNRWDLVAGGVRALVAGTPGTPGTPAAAQPRRTRPRRRTILAASAAAAVVLLAGVGLGTGVVHIGIGTGANATVLTAVDGCGTLRQADGTLEQVNGSSLVIKTASGQPLTITTRPHTFVAMSGEFLSDITDGASAVVIGPSSGGTVAAQNVTVGPGFGKSGTALKLPPGFVVISGTVSDATSVGFTVVTSTGKQVPVTTSGNTLVTVTNASLGQLPAGATIYALGQAGPHGTLSAKAVAAVWQLPPGHHVNVTVHNCSSSSVIEALGG